ncbi:hypothetical protein Trydic_g23499 [Trypoxylus dichotomus]
MERGIHSDDNDNEERENRGDDFVDDDLENAQPGVGEGDTPSVLHEIILLPTSVRTNRFRNRWTATRIDNIGIGERPSRATNIEQRDRWRSRSPVILRDRGSEV